MYLDLYEVFFLLCSDCTVKFTNHIKKKNFGIGFVVNIFFNPISSPRRIYKDLLTKKKGGVCL